MLAVVAVAASQSAVRRPAQVVLVVAATARTQPRPDLMELQTRVAAVVAAVFLAAGLPVARVVRALLLFVTPTAILLH